MTLGGTDSLARCSGAQACRRRPFRGHSAGAKNAASGGADWSDAVSGVNLPMAWRRRNLARYSGEWVTLSRSLSSRSQGASA